MKNSRFTSFTLPHSLTTLNLSRSPICFLPPSIKDIGTLNYLSLAECKMLQTLLEIPSNLVGLDVSYCYSLQRIANLIPFTIARDCDQLVHIQDWIKLELIQKVDSLVENNGNGQRSNADVEISDRTSGQQIQCCP